MPFYPLSGDCCARHDPGQQATAAACNRLLYAQVNDPSATISSIGLANGDSITVRQAAAPEPVSVAAASAAAPGLEASAAAANGDGYAMVSTHQVHSTISS
jgi:hypothetical protein